MKTPAQLIDLYYQSVGRGANLLLNVPPNRDGLLSAEDIASLQGFGEWRRATFGKPVASTKGLELKLEPSAEFNVIRLREDIRHGQRIDAVVVQRWDGSWWKELATATSVGPRRLIRLGQPITAERLRVRVTQSSAPPEIVEFAVFAEKPRATDGH